MTNNAKKAPTVTVLPDREQLPAQQGGNFVAALRPIAEVAMTICTAHRDVQSIRATTERETRDAELRRDEVVAEINARRDEAITQCREQHKTRRHENAIIGNLLMKAIEMGNVSAFDQLVTKLVD